MKFLNSLLLLLVVMLCTATVAGCLLGGRQGDVNNLTLMREAVSNQDYKLASRYAKLALKDEPGNREAGIILSYLKHGDEMMIAAFWAEDSEAVQYLAHIVHDINIRCSRFNAPVLVLAAAWGHADMVKTLLDAGADPNYGTDKDGLTALMWACKNFDEQLEMVSDLLIAGAEVNVRSNYNETPLSIAEEYQNQNIVALLQEYGAIE